MDTLGVTMIVGGMAFLCSGLIFMLPTKHHREPDDTVRESLEEIEGYLQQMRKVRSDTDQ